MKRKKSKNTKMPFSKWVIVKVQQAKIRWWVISMVIITLAGQLINVFGNNYFTQFTTHQLLLIAATTMLISAMRGFFNAVDDLEQSLVKGVSRNPELRGLIQRRLRKWQLSKSPFFLAAGIAMFFFFCIVRLEYIRIDTVGVYAIFLGGGSVYIGVYSYYQYFIYLRMIHEMATLSITNYNIYSPADTGWIVQIAKTSQRLRNYFLGIGLIYVVEYSILVPSGKISIGDSLELNTPDNLAFIGSWVVLFLLVIIAFPILNTVQHKLIAKVVIKMKNSSTSELTELMHVEKKNNLSVKDKLINTVVYNILISNIKQAKDYPIKRQLSYEALMTMVTLIVHVFNLYSKITEIPWISNLLS